MEAALEGSSAVNAPQNRGDGRLPLGRHTPLILRARQGRSAWLHPRSGGIAGAPVTRRSPVTCQSPVTRRSPVTDSSVARDSSLPLRACWAIAACAAATASGRRTQRACCLVCTWAAPALVSSPLSSARRCRTRRCLLTVAVALRALQCSPSRLLGLEAAHPLTPQQLPAGLVRVPET